MMTNNIYQEANEELDRYNFDGACTLFRKAASIAEPNQSQLSNLSIAEKESALDFRRHLCNSYPDSFSCRLSLMQEYLSCRRPLKTIEIASSMLDSLKDDNNSLLIVRLVRLEAAMSAALPDLVLDDFLWIWNAGISNRGAAMLRKRIVILVARCSDQSLSAIFKEMSQLPYLSNHMSQFFLAKSDELSAVRLAIELIKGELGQ